MSGQRLTTRDFKAPLNRRNAAAGRWRDMGIGLGAGLLVALVVYIKDHRAQPAPPAAKNVAARGPDATSKNADAAVDDVPVEKFEFYDRLPKLEVIVPEKSHDARHEPATAKITQPGTYVLQAGSYRQAEDAERARAKLAKLGVTAAVQRISIDDDVWHRLRVGPINDLEQLNRVRDLLYRANIDPIVTRVGD